MIDPLKFLILSALLYFIFLVLFQPAFILAGVGTTNTNATRSRRLILIRLPLGTSAWVLALLISEFLEDHHVREKTLMAIQLLFGEWTGWFGVGLFTLAGAVLGWSMSPAKSLRRIAHYTALAGAAVGLFWWLDEIIRLDWFLVRHPVVEALAIPIYVLTPAIPLYWLYMIHWLRADDQAS